VNHWTNIVEVAIGLHSNGRTGYSGALPTSVQILVLAHFPGFIPEFSGVMR
jgi:hypothetical protein